MRGVLVLALLAGALAACTSLQASPTAPTALRVAYWDGPGTTPDVVLTLRCAPPGGSVARPANACERLRKAGPKLFAPTPRDLVCTQLYGGPQRARVSGVVAGKRVWTTFTRKDGCEIARWQRLAPWLLPPGGVT